VIGKRLEVYDAQTKPLIKYYTEAGLLRGRGLADCRCGYRVQGNIHGLRPTFNGVETTRP